MTFLLIFFVQFGQIRMSRGDFLNSLFTNPNMHTRVWCCGWQILSIVSSLKKLENNSSQVYIRFMNVHIQLCLLVQGCLSIMCYKGEICRDAYHNQQLQTVWDVLSGQIQLARQQFQHSLQDKRKQINNGRDRLLVCIMWSLTTTRY